MPFISRSTVCALCENQAGKCGQEKCPVYKAPVIDVEPVIYGHWIPPEKWSAMPRRTSSAPLQAWAPVHGTVLQSMYPDSP